MGNPLLHILLSLILDHILSDVYHLCGRFFGKLINEVLGDLEESKYQGSGGGDLSDPFLKERYLHI